jgi:hypothetical protein
MSSRATWGCRSPARRVASAAFAAVATDGVRPVFGDWPAPSHVPENVAARILEQEARDGDDALVLVARYRGGGPPTNAA